MDINELFRFMRSLYYDKETETYYIIPEGMRWCYE